MSSSSANSSSSSSTSSDSGSEDESLQLTLTVLSLPATPPQAPSSLALPPTRAKPTLPPVYVARYRTIRPCHQVRLMTKNQHPFELKEAIHRPRLLDAEEERGIREGLSRLPEPPCPFGSQLGATPIPSQSTRSTPYHHQHSRDYFDPHPSNRAPALENLEMPRADPEAAYQTMLSAWESIKSLAEHCAKVAVYVITEGGKKSLESQILKGAMMACIFIKPKWILNAMNNSYFTLKDPFKSFHHTMFSFVIAKGVLS